jgi:hypothetical protein
MSRKSKHRRATGVPGLPVPAPELAVVADPPATGLLDCIDPQTGQPDPLPFWLPDGMTIADLGLTRAIEVAP